MLTIPLVVSCQVAPVSIERKTRGVQVVPEPLAPAA
jgi:hypothetical protein